MVLITVALCIAVLTLLILNKILYGGMFLFPWSHNNPYNIILREIEVVRVALEELGEELNSDSITHDEYLERFAAIREEIHRLSKVEIP